MKIKKNYYISKVNLVPLIQENGIEADAEGSIFLFVIDKGKMKDILNIAGYITTNQLFLDEYALFEVFENGITGEMIDFKTSGRTEQYQKILKQKNIHKDHIKFVNCYKTYFAL